jgi:tRNA(Arg) A34 adenosine deaminase TadA
MQVNNVAAYIMGIAAHSNVEKRKVGCVVLDANNTLISAGYNESRAGEQPDVHAEVNACNSMVQTSEGALPYTAYVTHPPCPECAKTLASYGVHNIVVVEEFIKFDSGKLRPDLIPATTTRALAEVLTAGARKYKPNNWRECTDLTRYEAALKRHLLAHDEGETHDAESGQPHLWHAITNLAFLIELNPALHKSKPVAEDK